MIINTITKKTLVIELNPEDVERIIRGGEIVREFCDDNFCCKDLIDDVDEIKIYCDDPGSIKISKEQDG